VRRTGGWTDGRKNPVRGLRMLKLAKNGYLRVTLFRDRGKKEFPVHRLVFESHVRQLGPNEQVNHVNGIKTCNVLYNLQGVTPSENQLHSYRILENHHFKGSESGTAKVTEDEVLAMRALRKRGWFLKDIAKEFGLSTSTVCWICKSKAWKHI
jgi:AraC-like DNA-binding protein